MNSHVKTKNDGVIAPVLGRGQKTQDLLIAATLRLLEHKTFQTLSIADIASEANVAVGSFYRRFKSKEALLPILYEHYDAQYAAWIEELAMDARLRNAKRAVRLHAFVEQTYNFFEKNAGLLRAIHLNSRIDPSIVPAGSYSARQHYYSAAAAIIDPGGLNSKHAKNKAKTIMLILVSTLTEQVLYPSQTPASGAGVRKKALIDALSKAAEAIAQN